MNCPLLILRRRIDANFAMERTPGRLKTDRPKTGRPKHAMPADFCRVFDDHVDDLYTLALLLTADRDQAEKCFVSGLEDSVQGTPVFREWAHSWAKRTVIKNAIRMISPLQNEAETASGVSKPAAEGDTPAAAIMKLPPLYRFVYVMSVLEKYSDRECSILLDCTVKKVVDARIRALQRFVNPDSRKAPVETAPTQGAA